MVKKQFVLLSTLRAKKLYNLARFVKIVIAAFGARGLARFFLIQYIGQKPKSFSEICQNLREHILQKAGVKSFHMNTHQLGINEDLFLQ